MFWNNKAVSPLVATFLLVIFSLVLGSIIMNLGKNYITNVEKEQQKSSIVIPIDYIDNELKELQIKYITNQISYAEYLEKEKELIGK